MNLQSIKQRFGIIGNSEGLERALSTAARVAPTDLTVLIQGASGVGKEVFSKIIHSLSPRKHEKFIAINCGAIPEGTINSELFGHEKGAFTGAATERKGYFETYNKGTIFLDEVGEMPLETQAYLLRILESGEYIKVGSSKTMKTDVRVIAATNVNLQERIKNGRFREDLYYRLNTVPITVPSLKERRDDIYLLFRKFASDFGEKYRTPAVRLDERARLVIENYDWPGNIRELKNIVEQLSVLTEEKQITAEYLVDFMPHLLKRNLPALRPSNQNGSDLNEREILYKILFELRKEVGDLKSLVVELVKSNNLLMPDLPVQVTNYAPILSTTVPSPSRATEDFFMEDKENMPSRSATGAARPVLVNPSHERSRYDSMEVVEESLSLAANEKELIKKALKKHKGRRKDAALELEISERTLYRKIKEYEL